MCWFSKDLPKERIAKEDIICYKVIRYMSGNIYSYYQKFRYEQDKVYSLNCPIKPFLNKDGIWIIEKAFHSYRIRPSYYNSDKFYVGNFRYTKALDSAVVMCTIPKGAHYYMNDTEYVSDSIIINELSIFSGQFKLVLEEWQNKY